MTGKVLLIGTLDTKGREYAFVKSAIEARGHRVLVMDVSVLDEPPFTPDITADAVATAAGTTLAALRDAQDRGMAMQTMAKGAALLTAHGYVTRQFEGLLAMGGSGGTAVASSAMRALPMGAPKVMVSTMASGDVSAYVDISDVTMMYSVVDIAGLNRITRRVFNNAAGAICGMIEQENTTAEDKPLIAASMFGVTTPCVTTVQQKLESAGYEVVTFHATGSGGRAMEALIREGYFTAVADLTTTEWCDELVGGVLSAGPTRLDAAAQMAIPQVVSVGALDMVNFGSIESIPARFKERRLHVHNPQVTLMRTTAEECRQLGEILAKKLNQCKASTTVLLPLKGVSAIDVKGEIFYDPVADNALFDAIRGNLSNSCVSLLELDQTINDTEFADAAFDQLLSKLTTRHLDTAR